MSSPNSSPLVLQYICPLLLTLLLVGCSTRRLVQTDLYFGLSQPGGQTVPDSSWNRFAGEHIASVFPDGFTVVEGSGSWKDATDGTLRSEPSRLVISINRMNRQRSSRIDSLRQTYRRRFHQQSVLRTDRQLKASF